MRKIAIPTLNGHLSAHFGGSEYFSIFDINESSITSEALLPTPEHTPGAYPKYLADHGVTDVILGGVGQRAVEIFNENGINVYTGAPAINPKDLVLQFIAGTLIVGENSCDSDHDHDHHHEHGHGHHHHH
ncbi:MAG: ATPase [Bacteroidales bacterium]|nr:ATPase [Bacteroidales bacterium]